MRAGLQRTDNNMEFTTWPQVNMINQKNYYTCVTFPHLPTTIPDLTSFTPSSLSRTSPCIQGQWWDGKCSMACARARKMSTP
jgi:hypothetical protein